MTMWGHAMRRRAVICGAIVALVAALVLTFSHDIHASAAPSPRSTCASSVHTTAGTTCAVDPGGAAPAAASPARLADTGFPAIAFAITGAFVLGCGLLFVTIGRRRRN